MKTPIVMFPTETLLLDDDPIYARLFAKNIKRNKGVLIKPIVDAKSLLKQGSNDFLFYETPELSEKPKNRLELSTNTLQLKKQLQGSISVLIADYHMPGMNGVEFFKTITSPFVYKILISNFIDSGYSDEINSAINNGFINAFLDKKRSLESNLKQSIAHGQKRFFSFLSNEIMMPSQRKRISDPDFSAIVQKLIDKMSPQSMHANEELSCFQFKNKEIKNSLFITTIEDTAELLESYQAENASKNVIEKLASHKFMLSCPDPFGMEGSSWGDFIKPAQKVKGHFNEYLFTTVEEVINE